VTVYINGVEKTGPLGTPQEIRDALLSLPDGERKFIITDPGSGEHKIFSIRRNAGGNIEYDHEDEPES